MIIHNQNQRYKQNATIIMGGLLLVIPTACNRLSHKYNGCDWSKEESAVSDPLLNKADYLKMRRLKQAITTTNNKSQKQQDKDDRVLLHYAALLGDLSICDGLDYKSHVNVQDKFGKTALHYAAPLKDVSIVKTLLAAGAEVNIRDHSGATALCYAVLSEKLDNVEALISAGADVRIPAHSGITAWTYATLSWNVPIMEALLSAATGIRVNDKCDMYVHLLRYAVCSGNLPTKQNVIDYLMDLKRKNEE